MSQTKLDVMPEYRGLGTLEPKNDDMKKYKLQVANGVINTKDNVLLDIFVSKFSN